MLQYIRNRSKALLWILVVIVVVSFSLWGTYYMHESLLPKPLAGTIGGREITIVEFEAAGRDLLALHALRTGRMASRSALEESGAKQEIWSRLLLLDAARSFGISISDDEVAAAVKESPIYQDDKGAFDPNKYRFFVSTALPALGFTEELFHELLRNELTLNRCISLITAGVSASDSDISSAYQKRNALASVASIEFSAKNYEATAKPSESDIQRHYESAQARYSTPEKRRVLFAQFSLPKTDQKLSDSDKEKALEKLGNDAVALTVDLLDENGKARSDFKGIASKHHATVNETPFFSAQNPPADWKEKTALLRAAAALSLYQPDSDVIQDKEDCYVLRLVDVTPPEPLPLEQVKSQIVADLTGKLAREAAYSAAIQARDKIRAAMTAGKSLAEASLEYKAQTTRSKITPSEKNSASADNRTPIFAMAVASLDAGEVSDPVPFPSGPTLIAVEARDHVQPEDSKLSLIKEEILATKKSAALREWQSQAMRRKNTAFLLADGR